MVVLCMLRNLVELRVFCEHVDNGPQSILLGQWVNDLLSADVVDQVLKQVGHVN